MTATSAEYSSTHSPSYCSFTYNSSMCFPSLHTLPRLSTIAAILQIQDDTLMYVSSSSYLSPLTALIDAVITLPLPSPFNNPLIFLLTITFSYNIYASLLPLWRPKDEITDIPLTPTQRSLLGLNPNSTPSPTSGAPPATQGSNYITPPRYPRSPVLSPGSSRSGASASTGNTPASASRQSQRQSSSPLTLGLRESAMLESPMTSSPLWPKTRAAVALRRRNSSHSLGGTSVGPGTPSPLGQGIRGGGGGVGGGGEKASVGLNSKWLYERGRSSSGSMSGKSIYL